MQNLLPAIATVRNDEAVNQGGHLVKKNVLQKERSFAEQVTEKFGEASQPPESGSTLCEAAMREEVHQATRAEFAKSLRSVGINPDLYRLHLGTPLPSAQSDKATPFYSVIDLVTSNISPALS